MSTDIDTLHSAPLPAEQDDARGISLSFPHPSGLFSFRYSSVKLFTQDGDLHVKMKETCYQNGRITSEECEGRLDRQAYDRLVSEAQHYFLHQTTGFTRLMLAPFTLFSGQGRRGTE